MVKPVDADPHLTGCRFPEISDFADEGAVRSTRGQENCTISNLKGFFLLAMDLFVPDFGPTFLVAFVTPSPKVLVRQKGCHSDLSFRIILRNKPVSIMNFSYEWKKIQNSTFFSDLILVFGGLISVDFMHSFSFFAFGFLTGESLTRALLATAILSSKATSSMEPRGVFVLRDSSDAQLSKDWRRCLLPK